MTEDFAGKIALVTGGGSGIGAATCRAFAAAGAQVAILDRSAAAAEAVVSEITRHNSHAAAYALDVVDRDDFARLTEGVTEAWGGFDILVNGAGTTVRRMIGEMGAEDWDRVIAVNLTGAVNGIEALVPAMRWRRRCDRQHRIDRREAYLVWRHRELFGVEGGPPRVDAARRLRA